MEFLSNVAKGKFLTDDALGLSEMAAIRKKVNKNTINAILGTFYYDDGTFKVHDIVKEVLNTLNDSEMYLYSTSDGGANFSEACLKHFFSGYYQELKDDLSFGVIATPGGTGALVSSIYPLLNPGDTLLIPTPCWGPYYGIGEHRGYIVDTFYLFDHDKFNLQGFIDKANAIVKKQNKLVFFLNDPCNNPTGYTLSDVEFKQLIAYLNSLTCPVVMVYDSAYMDMDSRTSSEIRNKFTSFKELNDNVIVSIALSFSKTFFIYGQRLGAQIIVGKDKKIVDTLYDASCYLARNTWSNCNKEMINLVIKLTNNQTYLNKFDQELQVIKKSLENRSKVFLEECLKVGIKPYPYEGGFFISFETSKAKEISEELSKEDVFVLPIKNILRIAICSISIDEARRLPHILAKYLKA